MATINPVLNSVAHTAYANTLLPNEEAKEKVSDRETPKTSASGNTTVTLSEAALQKSRAEQDLATDQFVKDSESLEQRPDNERNETLAGLSYGSQVK